MSVLRVAGVEAGHPWHRHSACALPAQCASFVGRGFRPSRRRYLASCAKTLIEQDRGLKHSRVLAEIGG